MSAWQIERMDGRIELAGELRIVDATAIWKALRAAAAPPAPRLELELTRAQVIDGVIMALIVDLRGSLISRGLACEIVAPEALRSLVHLYRGDEPAAPVPSSERESLLAQLGASVETLGVGLRDVATYMGEIADSIAQIVVRRARANWRALPGLVERAATDGIPIVLLLDFLMGFVMAYQSTRQLQMYGANIYVADIVGISITRELVPLMTAIIISGRSGAAYAAELGTMRVSEEIDALRTMGFAPIPYLVVPRIWALAIAAPLLTLFGDVMGVVGGLVVGVASLQVTPSGYLAELRQAVVLSDVWTGLLKSVAFGIAIAGIGCQQGLATRGAASGVGRGTTATVVYCLFTIVVIDTLFTVLFRGLGL